MRAPESAKSQTSGLSILEPVFYCLNATEIP